MIDNVINHIRTAEKIASNVSEEFRITAFEVVLNHLLTKDVRDVSESPSRQILSIKKHGEVTLLL